MPLVGCTFRYAYLQPSSGSPGTRSDGVDMQVGYPRDNLGIGRCTLERPVVEIEVAGHPGAALREQLLDEAGSDGCDHLVDSWPLVALGDGLGEVEPRLRGRRGF